MKKFIKNICAVSVCASMILSGCAAASLENSHEYPEGYEMLPPVTEMTVIENSGDFKGNTGEVALESGDTYAVIRVKGYGDITVKLFPEGAPYAVQNFIELAKSGYYDGKTFHRIISDFMIQGGSLNGDGTGGADSNDGEFKCEINTKLRHYYGALCYASAMGGNTCQFYIVNEKNPVSDVSIQYTTYIEYYSAMAEQYKTLQNDYQEGSEEYAFVQAYIDYYLDAVKGIDAMNNTIDDSVTSKFAEVGGVPFLDGGYVVFGQTVDGFDVIDKISAVETVEGADGNSSSPVEDVIIEKVVIKIAE